MNGAGLFTMAGLRRREGGKKDDMMTIELFNKIALIPALQLLPTKMDTPQARAMIIAICLQESRLEHRKQVGGPAHGFAQFEQGGGVKGVMTHPATMEIARGVCKQLVIPFISSECYEAITYNDVLACCFARLLLWTLPDDLPGRGQNGKGWYVYLKAWRPGKPKPELWDAYFNTAWLSIDEKEG